MRRRFAAGLEVALPCRLQLFAQRAADGRFLAPAKQRNTPAVECASERFVTVALREFPAVHGRGQSRAPGQQGAVGRSAVVGPQSLLQYLEGMRFAVEVALPVGFPAWTQCLLPAAPACPSEQEGRRGGDQ